MARRLRCGAGNEWLEGDVKKLPAPSESVLSDLLDGTIEQIRADCFKALHCLYIAVDISIADDVNYKVKTYITALENRGNASAV